MTVTPSELRADIYNLLDMVVRTGEPLVIERKGAKLKIVLDEAGPTFSRLERLRATGPLAGMENAVLDPNESTWDEQAWDEKWERREGVLQELVE